MFAVDPVLSVLDLGVLEVDPALALVVGVLTGWDDAVSLRLAQAPSPNEAAMTSERI